MIHRSMPMALIHPNMPPASGVHSILHSETRTSPNKTAIVTGAARGIGLEIAVAYAEAGAVVCCLDLAETPPDEWNKCKAWIEALPAIPDAPGFVKHLRKARLEYAQCDVTQQKALWDIVSRIADIEGGIDVCVACAGVAAGGEVLEYGAQEFENIMRVNVNGALFTAQAAAQTMVSRNIKGSIILIASMTGSRALEGLHTVAYSASKSAVLQLSRSLACELGSKGIRCNTISPGYIYSEALLSEKQQALIEWCAQNPLGRIAHLDEIRGAALFLGSNASSFCTGSNLAIDGGHTAW